MKNFNDSDYEMTEDETDGVPVKKTQVEKLRKILGDKFVDSKGN